MIHCAIVFLYGWALWVLDPSSREQQLTNRGNENINPRQHSVNLGLHSNSKTQIQGQILTPTPNQGVFAEKGAHFHGKWGLGAPKSPYTPLPPLSWKTRPPPPRIFSKTPTAPQEKGGGGRGEGPVGGGGAEAPFTAKTSPLFGENALTPEFLIRIFVCDQVSKGNFY